MSDVSAIRAAVIGTGFIGTVHVQALRRLGVHTHSIGDKASTCRSYELVGRHRSVHLVRHC